MPVMPDLTCDELSIPHQLRRNNRSAQDFTDGDEFLYRWFPPNVEILSDDKLSGAAIGNVFQSPCDISCNRQSLCDQSTDVLYNIKKLPHRFDFGVIQTKIEKIKGYNFDFDEPIQGVNAVRSISIRLDVQHTPEECMYPHSEILIFKGGELLHDPVKPPTLRTLIRGQLQPLFTVCHQPDPDFIPPQPPIANKRKPITVWTMIVGIFRKLLRLN